MLYRFAPRVNVGGQFCVHLGAKLRGLLLVHRYHGHSLDWVAAERVKLLLDGNFVFVLGALLSSATALSRK